MREQNQLAIVFVIAVLIALVARRRWHPSTTAFGTARWATESTLKNAGMLQSAGLIIGRTETGKLIRTTDYCHVLVVGATGSGKGVSLVVPNMLGFYRGSVVCFDPKGDIFATCAKHRSSRGQRIIRLAPFNGGKDCFNPLDAIEKDSPVLIDSARAMAEALVARGTEHDPHWNDKAVQVISALLVLVLMGLKGRERNLNSVREIVSDPSMLVAAAKKLREIGGVPARMGAQIKFLFESENAGLVSKEGASVLSTVNRHLAFLDSELVANAVEQSTFDPMILLRPGTTLFLSIPPDQLEAAKGLLRCWVSTLVRLTGASGDERDSEVLFLLDEASALGSLGALEESLVRGRSSGVRILAVYQSDSQVQTAFKDKPSLLYDNATTQIYLGASSIETAERISRSLGQWTQALEGYGENESRSWSDGGTAANQSQQRSMGSSFNYSVNGRALLTPDEVLRLDEKYLIVFRRGMPPILAHRIKYYEDPDFASAVRAGSSTWVVGGLVASIVAIIAWMIVRA